MRWLVILAMLVGVQLAAAPASAATCAREDFARTVDLAGEALRRVNVENAPRLRAKMRQLKEARGWADSGFEEKAYAAVQDERTAALDAQANDLLAKLDQLGTVDASSAPDCARLQELTATSIELQATVKAKAAYTLSKLDQMLGVAATPPPAEPPKSKAPDVRKAPAAPPAPKSPPPADTGSWSTRTMGEPPRDVAIAQPPPAIVAPPPAIAGPVPGGTPAALEDDGYTIDEIMAASTGFFGKVSAGLGSVIEYLFKSSGRPVGYVLGSEGGGAFLAGVRYGKGTLYLRAGETQKIYWHGPSIGTDVGADGSKTLFLIYRLKAAEDLYTSFTGIDGSAYLVGGVGATLVTNGRVILAPIRSGVGLRLGANIGYIRFTPRATWNPF